MECVLVAVFKQKKGIVSFVQARIVYPDERRMEGTQSQNVDEMSGSVSQSQT